METKPILVTALTSVAAGVGAGLLAFFCLPITVPVAVLTGVTACAVIGIVTVVNASYIKSELRMEGKEQGANELEIIKQQEVSEKDSNNSQEEENSNRKKQDESIELIISKLNSMEIKQDHHHSASCHRYLDLKTTLSEIRSRPYNNNESNSHQVISQSAQSTGLQNHGLFPSANDAQVNQVPSTTDTPNTTKKRPEFRNGAPKI